MMAFIQLVMVFGALQLNSSIITNGENNSINKEVQTLDVNESEVAASVVVMSITMPAYMREGPRGD